MVLYGQRRGIRATSKGRPLVKPFRQTRYTVGHIEEELRYITVGRSSRDRLIMAAHAERRGTIQIVSARKLTRSERSTYEENPK
jgi:uncharacterized DUF497 family protein